MRKDFSDWTYNDAISALSERQNTGDKESLSYVVDKDNWQDGSGWSGPQITGSDPSTNVIKDGINRDFTPKGAIPSVVRRHRRGVVGREPSWIVEAETENDTLVDEAYDVLLAWWNKQRGLREFRKAVAYYASVGRGPLRLYYPPAMLVDSSVFTGRKVLPTMPIEDAIKQIYLLAPKPDEASVITDTWSMEKVGIYTYEDEEEKPAIGICYVKDGKTVVKTLKAGSSNTQRAPGLIERVKDALLGGEDTALELNGNLLLFELDGEPLINESVRRQQKLLDKATTMLSHNMDEAGFREQVYFNAMPPGKMIKVDDPANPGRQIDAFVAGPPTSLPKGAGTRAFVQGIPVPEKDATGRTTGVSLTNPSRQVTEPIPVTSFTETAREAYRNILEDTDQLHILISGDATSSGESRKQARDDYEKSLDETKSEVDYVGSAVLETVLRLAAIFSGQPNKFDGLTVSFDCRIDPGPLSSEDRQMNINEVKEGLKSIEDGMQYAGIADPDAMKQKIIEERAEMPPPVLSTIPGKPANGDSQLIQ